MVDIATTDDGSIDYENATLEGKISLVAEAQGDPPGEIKAMLYQAVAGADIGSQEPEEAAERALDAMLNDAFESLDMGRPWGDGTASAASNGGEGDEATAQYDEYGTGMQGNTESELTAGSSSEAMEHHARRREGSSDDPDDYALGVQHETASDGDDELMAESREARRRAEERMNESHDPSDFSTGIQGDTSGEEQREREEQVGIVADAIREVNEVDEESDPEESASEGGED